MSPHLPPMGVVIQHEDVANPGARQLLAAFDQDVWDRNAGVMFDEIDPPAYRTVGGAFFVGYADGTWVSCGAYRSTPEGDARFERLFVSPSTRRMGLWRCMLEHLQVKARLDGYDRAVLQTGLRHVEAILLFRSSGWSVIPNFGQHCHEPLCVCFGKELGSSAGRSH